MDQEELEALEMSKEELLRRAAEGIPAQLGRSEQPPPIDTRGITLRVGGEIRIVDPHIESPALFRIETEKSVTIR